ncbi:NAD-dependent epimerase/dehydratase family protein [Streptomyces sp. TX20-6-3]|uniref:NAD-dependent epimerase/dehydratase family protein n=1 Tax=Streptomyces sp. TX20-6-3 TaxID=3028705 RepID=UPI0029AB3DC5|nr:NAD-dependent epimerase/dehydratase family protein [Streptomyces sp. TX20-6-3]MDX2559241.1 NAD-dependent epimerase/dehydratase family protein [Streptomyces sp. TX20-6-3]
MKDVLVIGGNRYFGKRLIALLKESGHRVAMLNRGSSEAPDGIEQLVADRDDEAALEAVLAGRSFDVVVDQVCYTPRQAEIARRVFAGRTRRYVMTSTVEVYEYEDSAAPVPEDALDLGAVTVDTGAAWGDPEFREAHYGEGKRQAEAVFAGAAADGTGTPFAWASVRVAHVLGGADDFTGRLDHYARRVRAGEPIAVPVVNRPATYVYVEEIAAFLAWAAVGTDFTGPVNAHSHGPLTTAEICAEIERRVGGRTVFQEVEVGEISPFSFARSYAMDNSRAVGLGYSFTHSSAWLADAVAETIGEVTT